MKLSDLLGMKVKGSACADTNGQRAPRDHEITEVWGPNENGDYVAWSSGRAGGEHLRASTEECLIRRVMSLK